MRDGGCLILVDDGDKKRRINPEDLEYQYPEGQALTNQPIGPIPPPLNPMPPSF